LGTRPVINHLKRCGGHRFFDCKEDKWQMSTCNDGSCGSSSGGGCGCRQGNCGCGKKSKSDCDTGCSMTNKMVILADRAWE